MVSAHCGRKKFLIHCKSDFTYGYMLIYAAWKPKKFLIAKINSVRKYEDKEVEEAIHTSYSTSYDVSVSSLRSIFSFVITTTNFYPERQYIQAYHIYYLSTKLGKRLKHLY